MYSILNYNGDNKKTAKAVITEVKESQITHVDFRTSLFDKKKFPSYWNKDYSRKTSALHSRC